MPNVADGLREVMEERRNKCKEEDEDVASSPINRDDIFKILGWIFGKGATDNVHILKARDSFNYIRNYMDYSWSKLHILCTNELYSHDNLVKQISKAKMRGSWYPYTATILYKTILPNIGRIR